jgi:hypothetical protein
MMVNDKVRPGKQICQSLECTLPDEGPIVWSDQRF